MVSPQVPTGGLIGQAILHDEPDRQRNDAVSVMRFGPGILRRVGIEEAVACGAAMLGIDEFDVAWSAGDEVAQVVQRAATSSISKARLAAMRAREMGVVATASEDLGFGQIFRTGGAFGGVW
jgi:hypothetical protein